MTNAEVIAALEEAIKQLVKRREEIDAILDSPIDPVEFPDVEKRVLERVASLTLRIHNLRVRLRNLELAGQIGDAVAPLTPVQIETMRRALKQVSDSIAATQNIKATLALAVAIS